MRTNFPTKSAVAAIAVLASPVESYGETAGVEFEAVYTADVLQAVSGGIDDSVAYLDNLDVTLAIDAEELWGLENVEFFFYGLYNNGSTFSESNVGDAQVVSNIETGEQALRLYEAWANVELGGSSELLFGLYDLNSEFDALDSSALFLGSAHGIGTDISQSGDNGPSIFPSTSLSLRYATAINDTWRLQVAALDGIPGDPDDTDKTAIKLGGDDGALLIAEAQRIGPDSRLLIGAWTYTSETDVLMPGGEQRNNAGFYVRGEKTVSSVSGELTAFGRIGFADDEINVFSSFYSGGFTWASFSEDRPDDALGVAFAWAETSSNVPPGIDDHEIAIELTYRYQVTERLAVQPNLQYVVNPGLDPTLDNALVIGARFEIGIF